MNLVPTSREPSLRRWVLARLMRLITGLALLVAADVCGAQRDLLSHVFARPLSPGVVESQKPRPSVLNHEL